MANKSEIMLRIYTDNFPSVSIHYPEGCNEPDYLILKIPVSELKLPDGCHLTKEDHIVKHNPNVWIPAIIPE